MTALDTAIGALKRLIAVNQAHETLHAPDGDDIARMIEYSEAFEYAEQVVAALAQKEAAAPGDMHAAIMALDVHGPREPSDRVLQLWYYRGVIDTKEAAAELARAALAQPVAVDAPINDRLIADTVNELRSIAIAHHGSQQLRERIAHVIVPLLKGKQK